MFTYVKDVYNKFFIGLKRVLHLYIQIWIVGFS